MTDQDRFDLCAERARIIVRTYRDMCPEDCDPENWYVSTTLITLAIISTMVAAAGTYMGAQAQSDAANYNAKVAANQAGTALQQGQFDAQLIRDRNRRMLAEQKAAFAANGVDPTSGSAADVRADSAQQGEMQALMRIYTGRTGATSSMAQATGFNMQAGSAMTAGYINVGSSVLQGGLQAGMIAANPNFR